MWELPGLPGLGLLRRRAKPGLQYAAAAYGCFHKLGVVFVGVLKRPAVLGRYSVPLIFGNSDLIL